MEARQTGDADVSGLLSIKEAAALIGTHRCSLYYLFRRGQLEYVEIGGRRFVPLTEARRYRRRRKNLIRKGAKA
jgi:excisionase family DNA binding protein